MSLNFLGSLIGTEVKINRGGPDSIVGRLLSVHQDFLVVRMNDGTNVFIQLQHIKSISGANSNASSGNKSNSDNKSNRSNRSNRSSRSRTFQRFQIAHTFEGLLNQLRFSNVQINRGGPEKIEGILVQTLDGFLLLVVNKEIIRVPIFHIKSINVANKNKSNGNNSNSSSNKNNNNKSNSNNKDNKGNNNKNSKATASQIVAIKLMLKKYRSR